MKQKDLTLIVVAAIFAGVVSLVVSKFFFSSEARNLQAEIVEPISADFQKPDNRAFNDKAINPTKLIQIGDSNNKQPF